MKANTALTPHLMVPYMSRVQPGLLLWCQASKAGRLDILVDMSDGLLQLDSMAQLKQPTAYRGQIMIFTEAKSKQATVDIIRCQVSFREKFSQMSSQQSPKADLSNRLGLPFFVVPYQWWNPRGQHGGATANAQVGYQEKILHRLNRLPRALIMALSFRKHVGSALSHVIWFFGGRVWNQGLDSVILMGPFQFGMFYDFMILKYLRKRILMIIQW